MLQAQVYCSLLFSPPQVKLVKVGSSSSSWLIQYRSAQRLPKEVSVKALKDGAGGETSGFRRQSWDPGSEIEVPFEQRPVNEYSSL
ncbi:protein CONSERVED IN THE GREEN LINEAGE AND DIATOMS 27, chloroplastic-like [Pyrus x bretschneideri]|uniref:protein CONSERVED IN THE GREEN LINEAGE AND DIATOMS 27, chloroplastic-like n=1 Tax=Pyrus x bretschneideri TaxID=225117 RepID=UPI00202E899A|nr:protein CONSERVED IN THE GREEN LINEAGE AND DIATOMS 27, chloroplastic-like [Pyrus x bretschneideri]